MACQRRSFQRARHPGDSGAAAVEFALILLPLLLLVGGIIDFGFAFNAQVSLTHAAREGVRVEALDTGDGAARAESAFVAPAVTNVTAQVVQSCPHAPDPDDDAEVTISGDYAPFFVGLLPVPNVFTLEAAAIMRCEP